jgi:hypothetical protein
VLTAQLPRQAPANADIAVVVDDFAEDSQRWRAIGRKWHNQREEKNMGVAANNKKAALLPGGFFVG